MLDEPQLNLRCPVCRAEGNECHALSFRYGQRHEIELAAAAAVARRAGAASHRVAAIDVACLAGSALTGLGTVPKGRSESEIGQGIPSTSPFSIGPWVRGTTAYSSCKTWQPSIPMSSLS